MSEIWRDIPGYEGRYAISDQGRIKGTSYASLGALKPGRLLKPRPLRNGYLRINLCKDGSARDFLIHRLVLLVFVGTPPNPGVQVNHKNGDKSDNRLINLEWVTQSENTLHAYNNLGHRARGETNHSTHLKEKDIVEIRALAATGKRHQDIAVRFGVSRRAITKIVNRESWKHVPACVQPFAEGIREALEDEDRTF